MTAEMTDSERGPGRARRAAASLLALTLLTAGAAACAQEADNSSVQIEPVDNDAESGGDSTSGSPANFEATTDFLKESATRSESTSSRVEMRFAIGETVPEDAPPMMQGEVDGDQFHFTIDLAPIMEGVMSQVGGGGGPDVGDVFGDMDLSMEMIGTGDTMYLRAPMFADMGSLLGGTAPGFEDLAAIGDGWGSVDLQQLGDVLPGDVAGSLVGGAAADPSAIIDLISNTEGVEDLGESTIRDTAVHGLRAEVTLGDMMAASGQDPDALAAASGIGDSGEELAQQLYDTTVPVEVWIDDDGYLARMTYGFSMAEVFDAMGMGDELDSVGMGDLQYAYSMDMFDYGETFTFEAPPDSVDITDAFAQIYQA
jgi:hypothetical protein